MSNCVYPHKRHGSSVSKAVYTRVSGLVKRSSVVEYMHIQDLLCSWRYGCRPVAVTRWTTPEILGDSRWRTAGHPTCYPLERPPHQPPPLTPPLPQLPTPFRLVASGTLPDNVLSTRVPSSPIADSWLVRRNCVCSSWSVNRIATIYLRTITALQSGCQINCTNDFGISLCLACTRASVISTTPLMQCQTHWILKLIFPREILCHFPFKRTTVY